MVGIIEDKILSETWNTCADRLNDLYVYYISDNINETKSNAYKLKVIQAVEKYEDRLKEINKSHAQANPQNINWDFREVLTKYVWPRKIKNEN